MNGASSFDFDDCFLQSSPDWWLVRPRQSVDCSSHQFISWQLYRFLGYSFAWLVGSDLHFCWQPFQLVTIRPPSDWTCLQCSTYQPPMTVSGSPMRSHQSVALGSRHCRAAFASSSSWLKQVEGLGPKVWHTRLWSQLQESFLFSADIYISFQSRPAYFFLSPALLSELLCRQIVYPCFEFLDSCFILLPLASCSNFDPWADHSRL